MKDRLSKLPLPKTIAKHYAQGKYCDYPADIIFEAVNSYQNDYNPTAIPIKIGFKQIFVANFNALVYLCEHRTKEELESFLSDPNRYMEKAGVELNIPFDDIAPKIFVSLVEEDMLEALRNPVGSAVCKLVYSDDEGSWRFRHPERYDKGYMKRERFLGLDGITVDLDTEYLEAHGFNDHMYVNLLFIVDFFADNE